MPDANPDKRAHYGDRRDHPHSFRIAAAGLDGKIYNWLVMPRYGFQSDDDEGEGTSGTNTELQALAMDTTLSFASSFLPIMLYQDSIQQLLHAPTPGP
jgi:hypothetical protein